jgi:RecA/RadA recombinase
MSAMSSKRKPKPKGRGKAKPGKKRALSADPMEAFILKSQEKWPNTIMVPGDNAIMDVPRISTGNIGLDIATFGGWPGGRVAIVVGKAKSGKTGTCLNTVVSWQQNHCALCYKRFPCDPKCQFHGDEANRPAAPALWIDAEHRLERMWGWVKGHGVDLNRFIYQTPPSGQHIVDFVDATLRERAAHVGLVVVDSVAMITSQEEIDKETMEGRMAPMNAQLINRALRKWVSAISGLGIAEERKPTILLINQLRSTMDQYKPEVQTGGRGLEYAHSIEVHFNSAKKHYLVKNPKTGVLEDKAPGYKSKFKPGEEDVPDYTEINYRVTESGVCPSGRYGAFNYWTRPVHGRRIGEPGNSERLWEYAKRFNLIERAGGKHILFGCEADSHGVLKGEFFFDKKAQQACWDYLMDRFTKSTVSAAEIEGGIATATMTGGAAVAEEGAEESEGEEDEAEESEESEPDAEAEAAE